MRSWGPPSEVRPGNRAGNCWKMRDGSASGGGFKQNTVCVLFVVRTPLGRARCAFVEAGSLLMRNTNEMELVWIQGRPQFSRSFFPCCKLVFPQLKAMGSSMGQLQGCKEGFSGAGPGPGLVFVVRLRKGSNGRTDTSQLNVGYVDPCRPCREPFAGTRYKSQRKIDRRLTYYTSIKRRNKSLVGFQGNLSLLDMFSFFPGVLTM